MPETATPPDPNLVDTTANHLLIRGVPHLVDDGLSSLLADTADSADSTVTAFANKAKEIQQDPHRTDEGKQHDRVELGRLHAEALHARKSEVLGRLNTAIERNEGYLFAKANFRIPEDTVLDKAEYRAQEQEARGLFRKMLDEGKNIEVQARLMEAARAGDLQTMRVFIHAPTAFPLMGEETLQEAIHLYAQTTQPDRYREWEQQNTARTMIETNFNRAWKALERMAGTRYTVSDE